MVVVDDEPELDPVPEEPVEKVGIIPEPRFPVVVVVVVLLIVVIAFPELPPVVVIVLAVLDPAGTTFTGAGMETGSPPVDWLDVTVFVVTVVAWVGPTVTWIPVGEVVML